MDQFIGYHSEWNLGSPGGWDYQRITQEIGKVVWSKLASHLNLNIDLDFDHPMLFPVNGLVDMMVKMHRCREGAYPGLIAVIAEEETLEDVVENQNLAARFDAIPGLTGALAAPQTLALKNGRVSLDGRPVSVIFMDFNTDVLLNLHRKHNLSPLLQAVRENRVLNPRGSEPINVKSMFEVLTDPQYKDCFHAETIARTPWTRQFYHRQTIGPDGEKIDDLIEWTRTHWDNLVLKPERGYSGKGVCVGRIHTDIDNIISTALKAEDYIVQAKVPEKIWAQNLSGLDQKNRKIVTASVQTDFRCLFNGDGLLGFVGRYGGIPTNVGSGGGFQPLALLRTPGDVGHAMTQICTAIEKMRYDDLKAIEELQQNMALKNRFTYLLGPIKIALQPRLITFGQMHAIADYCAKIWDDCKVLEKMWIDGELDNMIKIESEELEIARSQPWGGAPAIFASDGLFGFSCQGLGD